MNLPTNPSPLLEVGQASFDSEVLRAAQPVLVMFCSPWSRPCQILDVALREVAQACAEQVKILKVNADDHPDLSLWYEIQSVPTLLYFHRGALRASVVGTVSKDCILSKLQSILQSSCPAPEPALPNPDPNPKPEPGQS